MIKTWVVLSFGWRKGRKKRLPLIKFVVPHLFSCCLFWVLHVFKVNLSKSMASPMQSLASSKGSLKALQKFRRSCRFQVKKVVPFDDPLSLSKKRTVGMVRNKSNTTYCWIRLAQAQIDQLLGNGTLEPHLFPCCHLITQPPQSTHDGKIIPWTYLQNNRWIPKCLESKTPTQKPMIPKVWTSQILTNQPQLEGKPFCRNNLSHGKKKKTLTFHYTDCLLVILMHGLFEKTKKKLGKISSPICIYLKRPGGSFSMLIRQLISPTWKEFWLRNSETEIPETPWSRVKFYPPWN